MNEVPSIDQAHINAGSDGLLALKICLAFILFSLAIDIKKEDFKTLFTSPKSVVIGCISQMLLLPLMTFLLVLLLKPPASVAMGMILVAACPCGNMSTYVSYLAKGFIPLSITITALSTLSAGVTTPFNFYLYAAHYAPSAVLLKEIHISFGYLLESILLLLVLPLVAGILFRQYFERLVKQINQPIKVVALVLFVVFLIAAFFTNRHVFIKYLPQIFGVVFIQNSLAFLVGYWFPRLFKIPKSHSRSISIETGIHNSGLGLILVMTFFKGNGGMALIAAWWGIWHIIAGIALAYFWNKTAKPVADL